MAHRHKKAKGGRVEYNAQGSNVMKEAHEKKRGGAVKRKEGGAVPGFARGGRLDKFARGGSVHASGKDATKSPFSAAHIAAPPAHNPEPHSGK